jgi:hypothetical protein
MAAPWLPMVSPRAYMEAGVRSCVPNPSKEGCSPEAEDALRSAEKKQQQQQTC